MQGNHKENEIDIIFSCQKCENIRRKALNDVNEVNNIDFQKRNKIEKLKLLFVEGSLCSFVREILVRVFESKKYSEEIRRN